MVGLIYSLSQFMAMWSFDPSVVDFILSKFDVI